MENITQLLTASERGNQRAAEELLPLVYDELRKLAQAKLVNEASGHSLSATALVHEAYLRLVGNAGFEGKGHFFAAAAEAMRRVLVNHARDKHRLKRSGSRIRVEFLDYPERMNEDSDLVLSVDELLKKLEVEDSIAGKVASLHLFGGLSIEEAGGVLDLSRAVAYRNWKYARTWLGEALEK